MGMIRLFNCHMLDMNYNHTINAKSKQSQLQWFNDKLIMQIDDTSYQRKNNNFKVNKTLNELELCNYAIVVNDDGQRYFYFIKDKEYVNEKTTNLLLKLDVLQTYWFDINWSESGIEREHCYRWAKNSNGEKIINTYMEDENLETGEYIIKGKTTVYDYNSKGCYIATSSDRLGISTEGRPGGGGGGEPGGGGGLPSGNWTVSNEYLTVEEMKPNAVNIWNYFKTKGWTLQAVCGMLGNIQTESTMNPGLWESMNEGDLENGFGLVQWTPASKFIDWAKDDYLKGNKQCERIQYEMENGLQWLSTPSYPMTFAEFSKSTQTPTYLAKVFIENYERPFDSNQPNRGTQAEYWYNYLK